MKTVEDFIASLPKHEQNFLAYMQKAVGENSLKSYILLDGEVVETTMMVAVLWTMHHPEDIRVALETIQTPSGEWEISTVFLTQPHGVRGDLHFETMLSQAGHTVMYQSKTLKGAKEGHDAIVKRLKDGGRP